MTNYLRIGKIIKVFGIKGELKVFPTTDELKRFDKLNKVYLSRKDINDIEDTNTSENYDKIKMLVTDVKYLKQNPVIKFKEVDSIESAEKFIGYDIYISRNEAIDLADNEYFITDLIGLRVFDYDKEIGEVVDILRTKANSILSIKLTNDNTQSKEILVPMVSDFVKKIDLNDKKIYLETIKGML